VPGHDRLCDVGCADGQFLELAMARGWTSHGIELNPPAAAAARARGAVISGWRREEIDQPPWGTFIVTSWDARATPIRARSGAPGLLSRAAPSTTLNYDSLVRRCF
jgi:hypothetical protein